MKAIQIRQCGSPEALEVVGLLAVEMFVVGDKLADSETGGTIHEFSLDP
jgi:phosphoribosylaminoimidazole carboxylase (NCAIR synthetase)